MFRALASFLDELTSAPPTPEAQEHAVQLATAVLLVEVMRADAGVAAAEMQAVVAALGRTFALSPAQLQELVALAQERSREANDFFAFTSALNERFTHDQKIEVIEHMWQVAYADGQVDAGENHVISKVAGLLHVTHGEYIAAKMHARDAAGQAPP